LVQNVPGKSELQFLSLYANKKSIDIVLDALPKNKVRLLEIDSLGFSIGNYVSDQMQKLKVTGSSDKLGKLRKTTKDQYLSKYTMFKRRM
jgi:hypothetical protein